VQHIARRAFIAGVIVCTALSSSAQTATSASVSPRAEVTADGSFYQRVPLAMPVYHGLEPEVGLEHSSSFGNGVVGWGWRLLGEQVVERVAKRTGIPRMNATDEFQLNGNTLIPCGQQSPLGVSCASGGTHGLERETYQRVSKEGPDWLVWERDGIRSRFVPLALAGTAELRWVLSERTDPHGNHLQYTYRCDGPDECYLGEIEYADAKDLLRRTRIEYRWEPRPDTATYATARRELVLVRLRLQSIVVWANGLVRNALDVRYAEPRWGRWMNSSLVDELFRFGSDVTFDATGRINGGTHMPAEMFSYESDKVSAAALVPQPILSATSPAATGSGTPWSSWTATTDVPYGNINAGGISDPLGSQQWLAIDVNGDGLDDAVAVVHDGSSNPGTVRIFTHLNRGDGTFRAAVSQTAAWSYWLPAPYNDAVGHVVLSGDFNGDGLADLLAIYADATQKVTAQVALGTPAGRFVMQSPFSPPVSKRDDGHRWLVGDVDGDGRDDLIVVESVNASGGPSTAFPRLHTMRSTGTSFALMQSIDAPWTHLSADWPYWFVGDIDGDGRADIIRVESLINGGVSNAVGWGAQIGTARSDGKGGFDFSVFNTQIPNWSPTQTLARRGHRPLGSDLVKIGDFDGNGLTYVVLFTPIGPTAAIPYEHLRATVALAQVIGSFDIKAQDLTLGWKRQNNYSGKADSFPNRWLAADVDHDGVTDLVVVTTPFVSGAPSWPQPTIVITLRSKRDGTFEDLGEAASRTVSVPFDCSHLNYWDRCDGRPWFDVLQGELNGDHQADLLFVRYDQFGKVRLTGEPFPGLIRASWGGAQQTFLETAGLTSCRLFRRVMAS